MDSRVGGGVGAAQNAIGFRIKVRSREAYLLALDIMDEVSNPRCKLVGPECGNSYTFLVGGYKFVARRMRRGGLDVHEVDPGVKDTGNSTRKYNEPHGWGGVYDEKGDFPE